jgi:hypothetical protein
VVSFDTPLVDIFRAKFSEFLEITLKIAVKQIFELCANHRHD